MDEALTVSSRILMNRVRSCIVMNRVRSCIATFHTL